MKHIKAYEAFGLFKKRKEIKSIDIGTLKDLLDSELADVEFRGVNIGENYTLEKQYYLRDMNGGPKMKGDVWFGEHVKYAMKPYGNFDAFIDRGIDNFLTRINSGNYAKGISLDVLKAFDDAHHEEYKSLDIREAMFCVKKVYDEIGKERLKEYGIGCCLIDNDNRFKILFYPL